MTPSRKRSKLKAKSIIERHTLGQIIAMRQQGKDQTSPNAPEAKSLGEDFWSTAHNVEPKHRHTPRLA